MAERTDSSSKPSDLAIQIAGGIAAGIGVLGFVTLVGGAVVSAQLSGAGLPASRAVANVPRTDLLAIGARLLTPFAGVLGLAFLAVYFVERGGDRSGDGSEERRVSVLARMGIVAALTIAGLALTLLDAHSVNASSWVWLACIAVAGLAAITMWAVRNQTFWRFVALGTVMGAIAALVSGYALTQAQPDVRPVALVEADGRVLVGVFAAANNDEVDVGEVCTHGHDANRGDPSVGSLLVVPRHDVAAMAIGTNGSLSSGIERESGLLNSLPGQPDRLPGSGPPYHPTNPAASGEICTDQASAKIAGRRGGPSIFLGP